MKTQKEVKAQHTPELLEMLYTLLPCAEESDKFNKPSHQLAPKVKALIAKAEGGK